MKILILSRKELEHILSMQAVIEEVKNVYRLKAQGETVVWPLVSYNFVPEQAVMDIRSGYVTGRKIHGLKMLNNFPLNAKKNKPSFNGMLMVFDSETGEPMGVMDAAYITCLRTGAAGALGAKYLARDDSKNLLILGAGKQALYQIAASLILMPQIEKVFIADSLSLENARQFAKEASENLKNLFQLTDIDHILFEAVENLQRAVEKSDIVITITPSRTPLIQKKWVKPGTHFSCVGADMEDKEELDPLLFVDARVFADDKVQCIRVGEMELPIKNGIISATDIVGELGELLDGQIDGRTNNEQITIFDATGLALLDLVVGKLAIDYAKTHSLGTSAEI